MKSVPIQLQSLANSQQVYALYYSYSPVKFNLC